MSDNRFKNKTQNNTNQFFPIIKKTATIKYNIALINAHLISALYFFFVLSHIYPKTNEIVSGIISDNVTKDIANVLFSKVVAKEINAK